jgi:hypothetical protein
MSDYLEILPPYYFDDDDYVMVTVHPIDGSPYLIPNVTSSPIRLDGVWFLSCERGGRKATAVIPAHEVRYFLMETASDFLRGDNIGTPDRRTTDNWKAIDNKETSSETEQEDM